MKALRLHGLRTLSIDEIEIREPGDDEVLVRVKYVGICSTDRSLYEGKLSLMKSKGIDFPSILGHEWSGEVVKTGNNVSRIKPGDSVVGDSGVSCGKCTYCLSGNYYQCKNLKSIGTINVFTGACAEYITMPERHVFLFNQEIGYKNAVFAEPAATALYALRRASLTCGDSVLVHGTGPIGLAAVGLARLSGASKILITGRTPMKLDVGRKMGADYLINIHKDNSYDEVMRITANEGVDKIIETCGDIKVLSDSLDYLHKGGTLATLAFYDNPLAAFNMDKIVFNDLSIVGVSGSPNCIPAVIDLMNARRIDFSPIITKEVPFADVIDLFQNYSKYKDQIKIIIKID